jgi:iron(II)-dependent oxidoreductase
MSRLCVVVAFLLVSPTTASAQIEGNPLVAIEGGEIVFGNDQGLENEQPQRVIGVPDFLITRTEITNAQFRRFAEESGHRLQFYSTHPVLGQDDHPAVGVSWLDANDFCIHYGMSLPSEAEFERAARGHGGARYPWGDEPADAMRVSGGADECCGEDMRDGYAMTAPAGSFPAGNSAEGVADLIGNAWEWTRDSYAPYEGETPADIAGKYRVLRGGGWNSDPGKLSSTYRLAYDPEFRFAANGGFRCVRDPD